MTKERSKYWDTIQKDWEEKFYALTETMDGQYRPKLKLLIETLLTQHKMTKLPKVAIYMTAEEFFDRLESHKALSKIVSKNEKLKEIRVEGRISFDDYNKIRNIK